MGANCATAFKNLPSSCLDGNGLVMPSGLWFTPINEQFDTLAEAGDDANWISKIIAGNMSVITDVEETENLSEEDAVNVSTSQKSTFLFPGVIRLKFSVNLTPDQHKVMKTYNNKKGRMGFYDKVNNIVGASPDGAIFRGYKLSYIRVSDLMIPTDASPAYTTITVEFASNLELNQLLHVIKPNAGTAADNWYPADLPANEEVTVEQVGIISANAVVFDVKINSSSYTDNAGNPVSIQTVEGLDVATFTNFAFTDGAGATLTPDTMTESATIPGRYTGNFTAIVAGADVEILPTSDNVFNSAVTTFA